MGLTDLILPINICFDKLREIFLVEFLIFHDFHGINKRHTEPIIPTS